MKLAQLRLFKFRSLGPEPTVVGLAYITFLLRPYC